MGIESGNARRPPLSARQIAARYRGTGEKGVTPLLESLAALGQAEILEDGRYAA